MKKTVAALMCALALAGCSKSDVVETTAGGDVRIGIAKIVQHEALDAVENGIQDALVLRGYNVEADLQNANGDVNTAAQIANKFKNDKVDVAVGIATQMAQALSNTIKDIPVVFSAVTDPVGARLVTSLDRGEGNVTGLSDAIPTVEHIGMFQQIAGIKTLGYIYTSSEENSVSALALVEEGCKKHGITLVAQTINSSADLRQAAQSIVGRVDGVYLTTDNMVFSALPALIEVFSGAKKPIFSGDVTGAMNGGCLVASGFNYYKAGLATGDIIADILEGKSPADIPVKFLTDPGESDLLFDLDAAANCGITIPEDLVNQANYIFQDGELIQMQ
ncbi:MAG: ABC transporter substrate-binding protein [Treponema sp.]|jgi:putative ABC transport system substrate-binding protein|nr:ABC transporter substrate-binding protein [Treponema sp.]